MSVGVSPRWWRSWLFLLSWSRPGGSPKSLGGGCWTLVTDGGCFWCPIMSTAGLCYVWNDTLMMRWTLNVLVHLNVVTLVCNYFLNHKTKPFESKVMSTEHLTTELQYLILDLISWPVVGGVAAPGRCECNVSSRLPAHMVWGRSWCTNRASDISASTAGPVLLCYSSASSPAQVEENVLWKLKFTGWTATGRYNGQFMYLCTSTEAAWVQEREDVEAEGSWQQAGKVCSLQGEQSAHTDAQETELLIGAAQHKVLKHSLPLTLRPPVKLMRRWKNIMGFLHLDTHHFSWMENGLHRAQRGH